MKNNTYTLAIVIPCWNEEKLLPEMLDCLQKQTFQDWCAFCVDDQSTDSTAEIIQEYQAKDERIQYVCRDREPKGGQTCRNIGIAKAKGAKYLVFLDADDLIAPYCFEQRVEFMEAHPELDCGVFPIMAFSEEIHEEWGPVFGVKTFDDDLQAMLGMNIPMAVSTNIYRIQRLHELGLQFDKDVKSMQDSDFSFQVMISGMRYAYATEARADYFYRVTYDGVASTIHKGNKWMSHVYLGNKVTQAIEKKFGTTYDRYLKLYLALLIRRIGPNKSAIRLLRQIPLISKNLFFRMVTCLFMTIGVERLWGLLFYRYRKLSKQQNRKWEQSMREHRKALIERGYWL